jgi:hypothetical protein
MACRKWRKGCCEEFMMLFTQSGCCNGLQVLLLLCERSCYTIVVHQASSSFISKRHCRRILTYMQYQSMITANWVRRALVDSTSLGRFSHSREPFNGTFCDDALAIIQHMERGVYVPPRLDCTLTHRWQVFTVEERL